MEGVRAQDDPAGERDLLAREPVRVAVPVPALVRVADHVRDRPHLRHGAQHALADDGVLADDVPLFVVERAGLVQDLRWHRQLANVVQLRRGREAIELLIAQAEACPDGPAQRDDVVRVGRGRLVACLERGDGHGKCGTASCAVPTGAAGVVTGPAELRRQDHAIATGTLGRLQRRADSAERHKGLHGSTEHRHAAGDSDRGQGAVLGGDPHAHTLGDLASVFLVAGDEEHQLVVAVTERELRRRRLTPGCLCAAAHHRVSDRPVVTLVDFVEAVEVDDHQGEWRARRAGGRSLCELLPQNTLIAQAGDLVEDRARAVQRRLGGGAPEAKWLPASGGLCRSGGFEHAGRSSAHA